MGKRSRGHHFYGYTVNSLMCLPPYTLCLTKAPHLQVQGAQAEGQRPRDRIQQVVCQVEKLQLLQHLWGHKEWETSGSCQALGRPSIMWSHSWGAVVSA